MKISDALFLQCQIYMYKHNIYTYVYIHTHLETSEFFNALYYTYKFA